MQAKIKRLPYEPSKWLTLGVELELQLVDPCGFDLVPRSADVLDALRPTTGGGQLVPEVTAGMIELSTGICESSLEVLADLASLRERLLRVADAAGVAVSGGGTHPFQDWTEQAIFAHPRFLELDALYGYVLKQYTVFGQHVHVGCADEERVPTLLHQLSRYVPHLIALSAASPFVHGLDTGYAAARLNTSSPLPSAATRRSCSPGMRSRTSCARRSRRASPRRRKTFTGTSGRNRSSGRWKCACSTAR